MPTDLTSPIGCQVWPLRSMLADLPAFVKKLADIGVTRLELCSPIGYGPEFAGFADPKVVRTILGDHGMKAESAHFMLSELRETHQQSIDWAKEVGISQMITATLGKAGDAPTLDDVKRAAEEYNQIAAVSAAAGLQQGLHNEDYEHAMIDDRLVYDWLFDLLDPELVQFQFQMSALAVGLVGAEYFRKHPGRFNSIHLQDLARDGGADRPQVAMGRGAIDWADTFRAALTCGVKNTFVEQNWDLTRQSVAYLKTLEL